MNKENYYIVRTDRAGVFFGKIKSKDTNSVTMTEVRKIFYWNGAAAVEQIAVCGVSKPQECKLTVIVAEMEVLNPIQIIPCTEKSISCLQEIPEWKR